MSAVFDKLRRFFGGAAAPRQPDALIAVLLNKSPENGDRDDAAKALAGYDGPAAEAALVQLVLDENEDEDMVDSAGEALWEIWTRQRKFDPALVARMRPAARKFFDK